MNEAGRRDPLPIAPRRAIVERPFYFIVVLWGQRFRDYFLDYCLPSLLSPGNIPALATQQPSKFLIATLPEDWEGMRATAIFRLLEQHIEPVFVAIPPCPPGRSGCDHMGVGHKLCCSMAFAEKAYALILTPDSMLSDGTIAKLQERAAAGAELVLAAALRFGEEPFLGTLRNIGALPSESRALSGRPLAISGRDMVYAAVNGLHSETIQYEWEAPSFAPSFTLAPAAWWRVPAENGIVLHSLSWAPLLIDYAAIRHHDTSTLEGWTLDGDYLFKNFGPAAATHAVTDSDEMFIASWGPLDDRPADLSQRSLFGRLGKGAKFRFGFQGPDYDPLRRGLFFETVRWHAGPVDARWRAVEDRAMRTIFTYVRPRGEETGARWRIWSGFLRIIAVIEAVKFVPAHFGSWHARNRRWIELLMRGDATALRWLWWTMKKATTVLFRRSFHVPKPTLPARQESLGIKSSGT